MKIFSNPNLGFFCLFLMFLNLFVDTGLYGVIQQFDLLVLMIIFFNLDKINNEKGGKKNG